MNSKAQVNIIAAIGMIAATIIAVMNMMNYINDIGLSSQIYITAQNSIFQVANMRYYILQQAQYELDKAQLFTGLELAPTVDCGYINGTTELPQLGVPKIYYWDTPEGQACIPDNAQIELTLLKLLNESQFAAIPVSNSGLKEYININLTSTNGNTYTGTFTSPLFSGAYQITYYASYGNVSIIFPNGNKLSGPVLGTILKIGNYSFEVGPIQSTITGIMNMPAFTSAFFKGSNIASNSQYALITLNGQQAIVYTNETNGQYSFHIAILKNPYAYTLSQADGGVTYQLINNSVSDIDGTSYKFLVTNDINGIFSLAPTSYAVLSLQPNFVFMKYLMQTFQNASKQNLLFPNYQNLQISFSVFPLYNPEVCVTSNNYGFSLENCLPLAGTVSSQNYLSYLLQLSTAFVNQSFNAGEKEIQGFPQYLIYNYLENVIHGVNMKTVTVAGKPKYDWYSSLIFAIGSPNGINYTENQISCAKQSEYGTYIYNCSVSSSCLQTCQKVLSQDLGYAIQNLFNYQAPSEVSFLSGQPFSISVLNVSINATEESACGSDYVKYSYSYSPPKSSQSSSEEILGVPISLIFGYRNNMSLYPTEGCGLQTNIYSNCYPGFDTLLATGTQTFDCCSPVIANQFLNKTCIANLITTNKTVAVYINQSTGSINNDICDYSANQSGTIYYYCDHFTFNESDTNFEPAGYLNQWVLHGNACPSEITIDNQVFSPGNKDYDVVNEYGGGSFTLPDKMNEWSSAFIDNLNLTNMSLNLVANIGGAAPVMNIILSNDTINNEYIINSPSPQINVLQINPYEKSVELYNYSSSTMKFVPIAYGKPNVKSGMNQIQINKLCTNNKCNIQVSMNTGNILNTTFISKIKTKTIGLSTDMLPSNDSVKFAFISSNVNSYLPKYTVLPYQPATELNKSLLNAFGINLEYLNQTAYNQIVISNPKVLKSSYQFELVVDNNFDQNQMDTFDIKIFGIYSNGNIENLSWWNETPLGVLPTADLWINLTNKIPTSIYVVYGVGTYYTSNKYADNGSRVFPLFFSANDPSTYSVFSYKYWPNFNSIKGNVSIGNSGLILNTSAPVQPYIYETNDSRFYEQFACVSNQNTYLVNASYLYSKPLLNMQNLYGFYNPLYPGLQIVNYEKFTLPVVTTFELSTVPPSGYSFSFSVTYNNVLKEGQESTIQFITGPGSYGYSAGLIYWLKTSQNCVYKCSELSGNLQAGSIEVIKFGFCKQLCQ